MADSNVLNGLPHVQGTRVTVGMIVNALAGGGTLGRAIKDYRELTKEDIEAALDFAAQTE